MKKKWLIMGASLGIGAVMLITSGFSAMANTSGYDVYKTALKNNKAVTSISNNGTITVSDNGTEVLSADFLAKINREQNAMSMEMTIDNGTKDQVMNVFKQEEEVIFKNDESDVYRQMIIGESKWKRDGEKSGPPKHMATVIDTLMGNLKELATVEGTSDGGKLASLHLSGNQIPAVVNAIGPLIVSKLTDREQTEKAPELHQGFSDLKFNMPKLKENIKVKQIQLDAGINSGEYLEHQTGEIIITGTDESGINHKVVITLDFNLSDFNQTVPDMIDLKGKQVDVIQQDERKAPWHH